MSTHQIQIADKLYSLNEQGDLQDAPCWCHGCDSESPANHGYCDSVSQEEAEPFLAAEKAGTIRRYFHDNAWKWTISRCPRTVERIRREIVELEAELATLSGEPLLLQDEEGNSYHDTPPGGAILDIWWATDEFERKEWYPSTGAAKAALLSLALANKTTPSADGLRLDLTPPGASYDSGARITRRDGRKAA